MTPVVPFDPARTPARQVQVSLHDAYSEPAIRSFVGKLRDLAALSPATCAARFRALDAALVTMLEEARSENTAAYALRVGERFERQTKATTETDPQRVGALVQRLATKRPAAVVVIERLLTNILEQLHRGGAR